MTVFTEAAGSWTEQAELLPSDLDDLDHFGTSLDLHGDLEFLIGL